MKKLILLVLLSLGIQWSGNAQKVNDKIQIEHNGTWYDGTVLKVNAEKGEYFVSYDGWSESWNEWVGKERIRFSEKRSSTESPAKFRVGDRVEVDYGMVPEPAKIITVGENKYEIEYDNKVFGKKWVTEKQIRKL